MKDIKSITQQDLWGFLEPLMDPSDEPLIGYYCGPLSRKELAEKMGIDEKYVHEVSEEEFRYETGIG